MKRKYILGASAVALSLTFAACSKKFTDKPALDAATPETIATVDGIRGLLVGTYAALDGQQGSIAALGGGGPWEAAPSNWIYGSVAGGDAHKGSESTDQPPINDIMNANYAASNGFFNTKWKAVFDGVVRANNVLKILPNVTGLAPAEATSIQAEARFLRAHYYFELHKMYKYVPWIDETTTDPKQPNSQASSDTVMARIEKDFQFAYDNLTSKSWNGDPGRANKWAAGAYLGKTYLYEAKYPQAKTMLETVIAQGTNAKGDAYSLTGVNFEDNFNPARKNNTETVFDVQMSANNGSNAITRANQGDMLNFPYNSPFPCCGFYQPSQDLVNSYRVDANGLPYLTNYNSTPIASDKTTATTSQFDVDPQPVDPRLDWTVGRRGVPYLDWGPHPGNAWSRSAAYAGVYSSKKNVYYAATASLYYDAHGWAPGTAINVHVIRFADVLLMAAEAEVAENDIPDALIHVNMVRARAANTTGFVKIQDNEYKAKKVCQTLADFQAVDAASFKMNAMDYVVRYDLPTPQTWVAVAVSSAGAKTWVHYNMPTYKIGLYDATTFTAANALAAIKFERKLELAMEGQRFFDLARWGDLATALSAYHAYESTVTTDLNTFQVPKDSYFPIPQAQIDRSVNAAGQKTLTQNPKY